MAGFKIRIKGKDALEKRLLKISRDAKKEIRRAVHKTGEVIRADAVKNISRGGRSGATYKRGGVSHTASASGEFPKTDTGELVANITVESDVKKGGMAITVGSRKNAPQGYWLETKQSSEGGRPWLSPVIDKRKAYVFKTIGMALKKAVEKG